jgi:omega-3 fatty acid desaturase (delta-15 desaturase)
MPSNNTAVVDDVSVKQTKTSASLMNLANIRKAIPETAFKKSLIKSSYFMVKDLSLWLTSVVLIHALVNSSLWESLPFWQQALATLVYWNVAGFFMWCLFVIGHDCGHSTFSNYEYVNDIIGHITHGLLLVPFYPWQVAVLIY